MTEDVAVKRTYLKYHIPGSDINKRIGIYGSNAIFNYKNHEVDATISPFCFPQDIPQNSVFISEIFNIVKQKVEKDLLTIDDLLPQLVKLSKQRKTLSYMTWEKEADNPYFRVYESSPSMSNVGLLTRLNSIQHLPPRILRTPYADLVEKCRSRLMTNKHNEPYILDSHLRTGLEMMISLYNHRDALVALPKSELEKSE